MKKNLTLTTSAVAALTIACAVLVPTSASAVGPTSVPPGASIVADADGAGTIGGGVTLPSSSNAPQYVSHPEGGTWSHGTNDGVYSNYHHPSKRHGSTAMNGRGLSKKVTNIPSGSWSYASISKTLAGNSAYWHIIR